MSNIFTIPKGDRSKINCQWGKVDKSKYRFIILALGNTGSGKTGTINYMKGYAKMLNPQNIRSAKNTFGNAWLNVSHDEIVTQNPDYKTCVNEAIVKWRDAGTDPLSGTKDMGVCYNRFRRGQKETDTKIRRDYGFGSDTKRNSLSKVKMLPGLSKEERKIKWRDNKFTQTMHDHEFDKYITPNLPKHAHPESVFNADIVVYRGLVRAINEGRNIIYESTGKSFETIKNIIRKASNSCARGKFNYIILCSVNIIGVEKNKRNIVERFTHNLSKYTEDKTNPAPRLPPVDNLSADQQLIIGNVAQLIQDCTCVTTPAAPRQPTNGGKGTIIAKYGQCDGVGIDLLMLFNAEKADWRKVVKGIYPTIIPLSIRSQYLTPLSRPGAKIAFGAKEINDSQSLLGITICPGAPQGESKSPDISDPDQITSRSQKLGKLDAAINSAKLKSRRGGRKRKSRKSNKKKKTRRKKKTIHKRGRKKTCRRTRKIK
jgi:hypothetical protein